MADQIPQDIQRALAATAAARGPFGADLVYYDEVGSTNDLAIEAADRGAPEGTTIVAGAQTAGRGRLGRTWFSPHGAGLYVSTIVRRLELARWLTLAGGVAVAEGIRAATALPLEIKWPNDVVAVGERGLGRRCLGEAGFRARRKLAGVLAEGSSTGSDLQYVVLGFGINMRIVALPSELANRATSIEAELGRHVDAGPVLAAVLGTLHEVLTGVAAEGESALLVRWLALAPSVRGAAIEWDGPSGPIRGVTAGLDADGALLARTPGGIERILSGEVRWV